ncbi:MAG: hypothetical protein COB04_02875 [Gammaproteobacteria bacterium]|nr:MAG: hypothetical protein COB04_02875 [Gammaproteobacteria bacterium]
MKNRTFGHTLIELMIALAIGVFLLAGVSKMFTQTKVLYLKNQVNSDLQESGRFATEYLSKAIQLGHFLGGVQDLGQITVHNSIAEIPNNCGDQADFFNNASITALFGVSVDNATLFGGCINDRSSSTVFPSDAILVKYVSPNKIVDQNDNQEFDAADGIVANAVYLTTFSSQGELTLGSQIIAQAISTETDFNVWPFNLDVYYLSDRLGDGEEGVKSLMRYTLTENGMVNEVIAENIESLRILYGVDSQGDFGNVSYFPANEIAGDTWDDVVSAKVYVVAFSESDPLYINNTAYQIGDLGVRARDDDVRRSVMQTTVSIRNAVLRKVTQNGNANAN